MHTPTLRIESLDTVLLPPRVVVMLSNACMLLQPTAIQRGGVRGGALSPAFSRTTGSPAEARVKPFSLIGGGWNLNGN